MLKKGKKAHSPLSLLRRALNIVLFFFLIWASGFVLFIIDIEKYQAPPSPLPKTEAIIVLTGGSDRLKAGLSLLKNGSAEKLFLSGVHKSVRKKDLAIQDSLPVDFGYLAESTIDNAYEARTWLEKEKASSFFLVTAHYHMRRAILEFNQRLEEYNIVPYPIVPGDFFISPWWQNSFLVTLVLNEYNKYIVSLGRAGIRSLALLLKLIDS